MTCSRIFFYGAPRIGRLAREPVADGDSGCAASQEGLQVRSSGRAFSSDRSFVPPPPSSNGRDELFLARRTDGSLHQLAAIVTLKIRVRNNSNCRRESVVKKRPK